MAGFAIQLLLSKVTSKATFGQINAFISTVLLLTFLTTSAPTRQLVRELGAFGLAERRSLAEAFIGSSHLWLMSSAALAFTATLFGETHVAVTLATLGATFSASMYSAYFRGIGRYIIGNIEAGVIRSSAFIVIISIAATAGMELSVVTAKLSYVSAVAIGLLMLMVTRGSWPSMTLSKRTFWPYGTVPLNLTILAGLEIFFINFDVIIASYIYSDDVTAEVRVAQQLRSLTLLPLQIYLMFALDRLSRTLQTGDEIHERRREIALIRLSLAGTIVVATILTQPFGNMFFSKGIDSLLMLAVLSGVIPYVIFGPKPEVIIAASRERDQNRKTICFLITYVAVTPLACFLFDLQPSAYFLIQAAISTIFFASLPKAI